MIGLKGLAGGLAGVLLAGGVAMADAAPERAPCLRGAAPAGAWMAGGYCGHALRMSHRRVMRPILARIDGYPPASLLGGVPVRFTSLLFLGVGY